MKNANIEQWYCKNLDIPHRTIYFGPWQGGGIPDEDIYRDWEVNDYSIQNLIKGLYILDKKKRGLIKIIWTSYGGSWDSGIAAFDFIKSFKSPVHMTCYGRVRSMGTIILQACKKRILSSHCLFLIHYGSAAYETSHERDFQRFAERMNKESGMMEDIYLKSIKKKKKKFTRDKLKELMKYDKYMTPQEAVELGLADKILR